jgi:hypothetical protein
MPRIAAPKLEEYWLKASESTPEEHPFWLYLHFIDELLQGRLARKPLLGEESALDDFELLREQAVWIVGVQPSPEGGGQVGYLSMHDCVAKNCPGAMPSGYCRLLMHLIQALPAEPDEQVAACNLSVACGLHTLAALSFGPGAKGRGALMLYWSPLLDERQAMSVLKETVRLQSLRESRP